MNAVIEARLPGARSIVVAVCVAASSPVVGCQPTQQGNTATPTAAQVARHYDYAGDLSVEMSGNVAQVTVSIDQDEYRMGGRVWAMASPYIFLFSSATQRLFQDYGGLGGVRVLVSYGDGSIVAQALLDRNELNEATWPRALNVAGLARTRGTESPGYMRDLVRWGEEHTDYRYNPDYIQLP